MKLLCADATSSESACTRGLVAKHYMQFLHVMLCKERNSTTPIRPCNLRLHTRA